MKQFPYLTLEADFDDESLGGGSYVTDPIAYEVTEPHTGETYTEYEINPIYQRLYQEEAAKIGYSQGYMAAGGIAPGPPKNWWDKEARRPQGADIFRAFYNPGLDPRGRTVPKKKITRLPVTLKLGDDDYFDDQQLSGWGWKDISWKNLSRVGRRIVRPPRRFRRGFVGKIINPLRKGLRYVGAGTAGIVMGAGGRKQAFGLTSRESKGFEVYGKTVRGIAAAAAVVATGGAIANYGATGSIFSSSAMAGKASALGAYGPMAGGYAGSAGPWAGGYIGASTPIASSLVPAVGGGGFWDGVTSTIEKVGGSIVRTAKTAGELTSLVTVFRGSAAPEMVEGESFQYTEGPMEDIAWPQPAQVAGGPWGQGLVGWDEEQELQDALSDKAVEEAVMRKRQQQAEKQKAVGLLVGVTAILIAVSKLRRK